MTKKAKQQAAPSLEPVRRHRDCANAYGFCNPDLDGTPIMCRCDIHTDYMCMCLEKACRDFVPRKEPAPKTVTERMSGDRYPEKKARKVVPIFDPEDPRKVIKYVDAEEFRRDQRRIQEK